MNQIHEFEFGKSLIKTIKQYNLEITHSCFVANITWRPAWWRKRKAIFFLFHTILRTITDSCLNCNKHRARIAMMLYERDSVSNHLKLDCFPNSIFPMITKKHQSCAFVTLRGESWLVDSLNKWPFIPIDGPCYNVFQHQNTHIACSMPTNWF